LDGIGIVELVKINLEEIFSLGKSMSLGVLYCPREAVSLGLLSSPKEVMSLGSLPMLGSVIPLEFPLSMEQIIPLLLVTNSYLGALIPQVTYPFQKTLRSIETLLILGSPSPKTILKREVLIFQWEILTREVV
jgi:hypothetical protein